MMIMMRDLTMIVKDRKVNETGDNNKEGVIARNEMQEMTRKTRQSLF